jgi:hypothetical protein
VEEHRSRHAHAGALDDVDLRGQIDDVLLLESRARFHLDEIPRAVPPREDVDAHRMSAEVNAAS